MAAPGGKLEARTNDRKEDRMIDEETTAPVPVARSAGAENSRRYALGGLVSFLLKGKRHRRQVRAHGARRVEGKPVAALHPPPGGRDVLRTRRGDHRRGGRRVTPCSGRDAHVCAEGNRARVRG